MKYSLIDQESTEDFIDLELNGNSGELTTKLNSGDESGTFEFTVRAAIEISSQSYDDQDITVIIVVVNECESATFDEPEGSIKVFHSCLNR